MAEALYIGDSLNFFEVKSGIKINCFEGYPENFPQFQLSPSQRLCFYNWPVGAYGSDNNPLANISTTEQPFLDYTAMVWLPAARQIAGQGYYNIPLPSGALRRFLLGLSKSYVPKEGDVVQGNMQIYMYIRQPVVYFKGRWCWKMINGWEMLWEGVQYFVDSFLKQNYDVSASVYGNVGYNSFVKGLLWEHKHIGSFINFLSSVNFLYPPEPGKPGFFDKFARAVPYVWGGMLAILTAGAGTPALVGLIGAMAAKYGSKLQGQKDANQLAELYNNSIVSSDENLDKDNIREEAGLPVAMDDVGGVGVWVWIAVAAGLFFVMKKKR